jgi:hypothetical protein
MADIEAVWEDYFNQTWDSVKEFLKWNYLSNI